MRRLTSVIFFSLLVLFFGSWARAGDLRDFPVRSLDKTFIVGEKHNPEDLIALGELPRASVRVVLRGNTLSDSWIDAMNAASFQRVDIVLAGQLKAHQVDQLKKVAGLRVIYLTDSPIDPGVSRMLQALGPARKEVVLKGPLTAIFLKSISGLKGVALTLDRKDSMFELSEAQMLGTVKGRVGVILGENAIEDGLTLVKGQKRLSVVVAMKDGLLPYELAQRLAELGNRLTIEIPDSANLEAYKSLFEVPQFSMEVRSIGNKINPAMFGFLKTTDP